MKKYYPKTIYAVLLEIIYFIKVKVKIKNIKKGKNKMSDYNIIVIGAGPGGYVAAIRAAQNKKKVALVEKAQVGGVCLNIGCIPTKAIIHRAEIFRERAKLVEMGVAVDDKNFNYENVFNASRKTAEMLSKGVSFLLKKNGVDVIAGSAKISGANEVSINTKEGERKISADKIIIATGSRAKVIPQLQFDGEKILSSDDALMMKSLPKSALIVGGGAIGIEFAHIFNIFGVDVHVVEMQSQILPAADGECASVVAKSLAKRGIKIYTSSKISSHKIDGDIINATITDSNGKETQVCANKIFVMTGRSPNSEEIGLENVNIETSNGFIKVKENFQTNVSSIYAIGDVAIFEKPLPLLAHAASASGEIAADHACGVAPHKSFINPKCVPAVVYCEPQIASFGLTEENVISQNIKFVKSAFPFRACGKAVATDAYDGMVKIITDENRKILGAHIVGHNASELIHELLLAHDANIGADKIAETIHAHPTLSESIMESALMLNGKAIHI